MRVKIKQQRDEIRKRDIQMMNKLKHQEQKDVGSSLDFSLNLVTQSDVSKFLL